VYDDVERTTEIQVYRCAGTVAAICLLGGTTTLFAQSAYQYSTTGILRGAVAEATTRRAPDARTTPIYGVSGLRLGSKVQFDSSDYREYKCGPSDQFDGFTWCQKTRQERDRRGLSNVTYSILHSPDGTVAYVNRFQEPTQFAPNDADLAVRRYSSEFGGGAQIKRLPPRPGVPAGTIATWGKLTLEPVDADSISLLADGKSPKKGYLVDFIGNFARSAKEGLPIYRITGGAGFVWAGSTTSTGRGTLRLAALDPSAISASPITENPKGSEANVKPSEAARPSGQSAEPPVKSVYEDQTVRQRETTVAPQDDQTKPEVQKGANAGANNEIEKVKSEMQFAQAEVEQLKGERAQLNAALGRSDTQRNAAELRARVMQFIAYGSLGLLIALLAGGSVAFFIIRKKITAALRESESPRSKAVLLKGQAATPSSDTASSSFEAAPPASESLSDGTGPLPSGVPQTSTSDEKTTLPPGEGGVSNEKAGTVFS
jgi:hypothetical protein